MFVLYSLYCKCHILCSSKRKVFLSLYYMKVAEVCTNVDFLLNHSDNKDCWSNTDLKQWIYLISSGSLFLSIRHFPCIHTVKHRGYFQLYCAAAIIFFSVINVQSGNIFYSLQRNKSIYLFQIVWKKCKVLVILTMCTS